MGIFRVFLIEGKIYDNKICYVSIHSYFKPENTLDFLVLTNPTTYFFFVTFISVKENLISHSNTLRTNVLTNQVDFIKIVKC